jgi:polysaccharide deacetylase 2 family uncharacterized protein YibQ
MPRDELTRPLGLTPRRRALRKAPVLAALAVVAVAAAGAVGAGAWFARAPVATASGPTATAAIAGNSFPGRVDLAARTAALPEVPSSSLPARPSPAPAPPASAGGPGLVEVTPSGSLTEVGTVRIYDPSQAPRVSLPSLPDAALVETGAYGPLPKVAASGLRPLDAYAAPATHRGGARIAIVIGGVGLDPASTRDAIQVLPGSVTLAVAPYGPNVAQTVAEARALGHELLLQIPLEPYGYPKTDPGPHTLIAAATPKTTLDDLSWLLSRATNYVGVVNYMGGAFTTAPQAMTTLLDAIGKRGLLYLDDGSSPRSLASELAQGRAPFLKADLVIDPDLAPAAIDARLNQLAAIARSRGYAIGTATAFPATIERIAAFARGAAARDVSLVPVSSLVAPSRS